MSVLLLNICAQLPTLRDHFASTREQFKSASKEAPVRSKSILILSDLQFWPSLFDIMKLVAE